jgi:hypothetical protein
LLRFLQYLQVPFVVQLVLGCLTQPKVVVSPNLLMRT